MLSNYKQGIDYILLKRDGSVELRIVNNELKQVYGELIQLEEVTKCNYCFLLVFLGEQTPLVIKRYINVARKLADLGVEMLVYIYDCDPETLMFSKILDRIKLLLPGISIESVIEASSYLVLVKRFADRVKKSRERASEEIHYYEYQEALTSLSRFMSKLLRVLGSAKAVEELLNVTEETTAERSRFLEEMFGRTAYYTLDNPGECPSVLSSGLENIVSQTQSRGFNCLVIAEPLTKHPPLSTIADRVVSINLEA